MTESVKLCYKLIWRGLSTMVIKQADLVRVQLIEHTGGMRLCRRVIECIEAKMVQLFQILSLSVASRNFSNCNKSDVCESKYLIQ
jgi:hypothetical protein